jgi:glycosyltransferase involved in cell wall biosynthesis
MMTSIDVIVPCYRYGNFLRECVQSVLTQEGVEVRVLIIDDASPDNTPDIGHELTEADHRVFYRRHKKNQGHIATYNEGIDWISSKYYLLLSADDYLLPGALFRATSLMEGNANVGFCFGNALELHPGPSFRQVDVRAITASESGDLVMTGADFHEYMRLNGSNNFVSTPTAIVRTQLQKQLAGYRAELPHSGDMELWLRLAVHSSVGFVCANQAVYRRHSSNMSLGYMGENHLADLLQRKAAIDLALNGNDSAHVETEAVQRKLLEPLGIEGMRCAINAFGANDLELSSRFIAFAQLAYPDVRRRKIWFRYIARRALGYRASRALKPIVSALHKTVVG